VSELTELKPNPPAAEHLKPKSFSFIIIKCPLDVMMGGND